MMVFCLVGGALIVGRAALIQIVHNPRLENMARRQFQSKVLIRPRRGSILDRNGEPLAINMESNSLAANPKKIKNRALLARLLARATDVPYAKIYQKLSEKREFVWIKRHLPEAELERFKKWRVMDTEGDLVSGLWLVKESHRIYPHGELSAHVLGSVNIDSDGIEGVELWQDQKLKGKVTSMNAIKDALGRPAFMDAMAARHLQDGEPVQLTIDASLQFAVEQELKAAVHKTSARSGTVIVMNAVNGEILAMANEPSFNPNQKGFPAERRRNRALTDGFEPGSTLKAVLLASALSNGHKLTDMINGGQGQFVVQSKKISEAESHEKFEWISLKKIIQLSSNVGAAKLALKLGADKYLSTLQSMGFAQKTTVGFPGEISGRLPPRKDWQPLTLANIGFGQGMLATPLQVTRAYAAFLNGGWLVQPVLLKNSKDEKSNGDPAHEPPRRVLTARVADQVIQALESVTEKEGTGVKASVEGFRVAGKTGTAQAVDPLTHAYSRSRYISSFVGFPVGIDQKIVIFASIDEPKGVYYASETAAPLFRTVLEAVANRFSLPAKIDPSRRLAARTDRLTLTQSKPVPPTLSAAVLDLKAEGTNSTGETMWSMPTLVGLTPREALRVLQGHRFQVEVHGIGVIQAQHPEEGKPLMEGERIKLTLKEP